MKSKIFFIILFSLLFCEIPNKRVIAEWEPAIGTMIRWPLGIPSELVVELASDDILYVLVETNNQQTQAINSFNSWGINLDSIVFIYTDTYSHWTRDHGPQFVIGENYWKVVDQQFNGYPEESGCEDNLNHNNDSINTDGRILLDLSRGWEEDDNTNIDFANQMNWDLLNLPLFLTGGNFMTDGYGMGFSTQLMVNENDINNEEFKQIVNQELFLSDYHIFPNPNFSSIQHIDCLAKLVNAETVIIKKVPESSPEYECIENFADSFNELSTFYNRSFKIHRVLCPTINGGWWETNPVAAYTNSLILNNKILVPQYNIPEDSQAIQVYQNAMPGYEVIGFYASQGNPWYGEDALHCRTMGIFDPNMIHISHKSVRTEELIINENIHIESQVIDYGNINTTLQSVILYWRYRGVNEFFNELHLEFESNNNYIGILPNLNPNETVEYYIRATNFENKIVSHPNFGLHSFDSLDFILGDINSDNELNVQDLILVVNLILINEYTNLADVNLDNTLDILDIVQIVNLILLNQ